MPQCASDSWRAAAPARGRRRKRRGGRTAGESVERGIRVDAKPNALFSRWSTTSSETSFEQASRTRTRRSRYSHGERALRHFIDVAVMAAPSFLEAVDMAVVSNPAQPLRDRAISNPTPSPLLARRAGVAWLEGRLLGSRCGDLRLGLDERGLSSRAARQQRPRVAALVRSALACARSTTPREVGRPW